VRKVEKYRIGQNQKRFVFFNVFFFDFKVKNKNLTVYYNERLMIYITRDSLHRVEFISQKNICKTYNSYMIKYLKYLHFIQPPYAGLFAKHLSI